ncbi:MAG: hypothetical protein DRQ56_05810 [Gammaproteobacteria bacterium]|nr:MAG: hypothetical protein DRQ56_05810 [Gammaproteobacteria bacterium]
MLVGRSIAVNGNLTVSPTSDSISFDNSSETTPTIDVKSGGDLTLGSLVATLNKNALSGGTVAVDPFYSVEALADFGGAASEHAFIRRHKSADMSLFGATILTSRVVALDRNDQKNDLDTGSFKIKDFKLIKLGAEPREIRCSKILPSNIGPNSYIDNLIIDGGFSFSHRTFPPIAIFTLLNGQIVQLANGQQYSEISKFNTDKNTSPFDLGYDSLNTKDPVGTTIGSVPKYYDVFGSSQGSSIRSSVKENVRDDSNRRKGITRSYAPFVVNAVDTNGAPISEGYFFIRDNNNGKRKNLNGLNNTADKTYYRELVSGVASRVDILTGVVNHDTAPDYTAFLGECSLDYRGINYSIPDIAISGVVGANANITSATNALPILKQGQYVQVGGLANGVNNQVWQVQDDGTSSSVNATLLTGGAVNEGANTATIAIYGEDAYVTGFKSKAYLNSTPTLVYKGLFDKVSPQQVSIVLVADSKWSNSNGGNPLGLSVITNLDEMYDAGKQWGTIEVNFEYPTISDYLLKADGSTIDMGAVDLVLENSVPLFVVSSDVLTMNISTLEKGPKFNAIKTSGVITLNSGALSTTGLDLEADVYMNTAQDLTDLTIVGDLHIATGVDSVLNFDNVTVTGLVYNDSPANTVTINLTGSATAAVPGTGNGQVEIIAGQKTMTFTGLQIGSDVVLLEAGTNTVIDSVDQVATSTWSYTYSVGVAFDYGVVKQGYVTIYRYGLVMADADSEIAVAQIQDRNYQ